MYDRVDLSEHEDRRVVEDSHGARYMRHNQEWLTQRRQREASVSIAQSYQSGPDIEEL